MTDEVLVEHIEGMVVITINRPEQRNAVNRAVSYGSATPSTRWIAILICAWVS